MEWKLSCGEIVLIDEEDYNRIDKMGGIYLINIMVETTEKLDTLFMIFMEGCIDIFQG